MKTIEEVMEMADVNRSNVYRRLREIEKAIGEVEKVYKEGKSRNPCRVFTDEIANMIVNHRGKKPGVKTKPKLKNSSLTGLTTEDIDEVMK